MGRGIIMNANVRYFPILLGLWMAGASLAAGNTNPYQ
jgi:acyl-CoA reductase-like NAD-dependent aldehyde dehydrogenase